jgi:hypothetical protein
MSVDLQKILDTKRAFRRKLAALPVAEKLRMLDAMRERELAIRRNAGTSGLGLREESAHYRSKP